MLTVSQKYLPFQLKWMRLVEQNKFKYNLVDCKKSHSATDRPNPLNFFLEEGRWMTATKGRHVANLNPSRSVKTGIEHDRMTADCFVDEMELALNSDNNGRFRPTKYGASAWLICSDFLIWRYLQLLRHSTQIAINKVSPDSVLPVCQSIIKLSDD